jgi:Na+/melibiose symporter-like transporter
MRLSRRQLVLFSLPIFGVEFIIYPALFILPTFYAARSASSVAAFATAVLLSRIIYSWSGPLVGYLSDRYPTRWGRRKPWMAGGAVIAIAGVGMLFFPPAGADAVYFGWASALALFAFSIIDIPYVAWGNEITRDYGDRTRIASYRMAFAAASVLVFLLLPYLPGFGGSNLLNAGTIARLGIIAIVTVAVTVAIGIRFGPPTIVEIASTPRAGEPLRMLRALVSNRPMLLLFCATFVTYMSWAIYSALQLVFLASLGIAGSFGIVLASSIVANLVGMPIWTALAQRLGKKRSWIAGICTVFAIPLAYYALAPLTGPTAAAIVSSVISGIAPVILFMPYSALGDVIDYDELRSGTNHAASLSSLLLVVIRLTATVGGSLAFYALALVHFDMRGSNSPAVTGVMHAVFFGLPILFNIVGIALILAYPLDERRGLIVRRRLERRRVEA